MLCADREVRLRRFNQKRSLEMEQAGRPFFDKRLGRYLTADERRKMLEKAEYQINLMQAIA
jgi:hypothetical protein